MTQPEGVTYVPPIPRRDETMPPEDDPSSVPFVTRVEFVAVRREIERRLEVVELAQRMGDEALSTKLHEVSDAVNTIAGETAEQTKTLAAQGKALEKFATREELAQLATHEQLGSLKSALESKDAQHEKGMGELTASVKEHGKALKTLRAKVATRWQAYAQIIGILAAIAAGIASAAK